MKVVRRPSTGPAALIAVAALSLAGAPTAQAQAPKADAAKRTYSTLGDIGLKVQSASLKSRTLRVKVTATRPLALRFAIVRGTKQLGSAKISVKTGTTSLKLLLNQKSTGKNLRLRVTARFGNKRGRQRVGVGLITLPKPDTGGQGTPVTPNGAPTALALTGASVAENAPTGSTVGNVQGTDPNPGDTLSYAFASGAGDADNAAFALSDGTLRTAAVLDFEAGATRSVRLRVSDGRGGTFEQAFTVTVTNVGEAPTGLALSSAFVAENQAVGTPVGTLSATDPDAGDTASYSLVAGAGDADNALFAIVGSQLRTGAVFDREAKASYSVRARVTDGGGRTDERAFTITISDVNDAPTDITLSSADVAENQPAGTSVGTLSATDQDAGATASFSLVAGAGDTDNASFQIVGANLRTAAGFDFETKASYSVRIQASDDFGGTFSEPFTITITDVDDPAVAVDDADTVAEDAGPTAVAVLANDSDQDDPLSIASVTDPARGTVAITGGGTGLTYTPDADACNTPPGTTLDTFSYSLGGTGGGTATVTMTVTCVNDAPVVSTTAGPLGYTELDPATPVDAAITVTDVDSQIASATVQITGNYASGQDVLAYTAPGGNPVTATAFDTATGTLSLTGPATPAQFTAALAAVTYRNTSNNPSLSTRTVTFLASDGALSSTAATRSITISATDNAPDVDTSSGALSYTENDPATAIDTAITVTDVDSADLTGASVRITGGYVSTEDVLSYTAPGGNPVTAAAFDTATGTLTLSGTATVAQYESALEAVAYANTSDDPSTASRTVTFQARDAGGFGAADTHGITVTAVDDAPVAVNDADTVAEDAAATAVNVLSNDTDVDDGPISIASVTQPTNGTVAVTGGGTGLTYAPDADYCNSPPGTTPDTFTYSLSPGGSTATVSMTVTCTDDAPVAVDDADTVSEDALATAVAVLGNDTDVDGGPISITSVTQPTNGIVVITGGGTGLTYAPDADYCNSPPGTTPDTFTYTLSPGGSSATVSMTVTCGDDPPTAVDDSATVGEDSGATAVPVLANDTDPDGGPISIASVTQPTDGTVVVTGGGTGLTYQPDANFCNSPPPADTFTYTLTPGGSSATVSMTVTCVDDAPVVDTTAGSLAYTENDPASVIDPGVTITDADVGGALTGVTAQITSNFVSGEDVLALANAATHLPITASFAGGTLTLTGTASIAAYQAAARDITYVNTSEAPSTLTRTVTFTATDTTALSGSDTRAISVTSVDDAPVAVNDSATVLEDAAATAVPVLTNDTDIDGGPKLIASASDPTNGTVALTGGTPGNHTGLTYTPDPDYCNAPPTPPADTFTYTLTPGGSSATVSMTVTCVNDAPVADDETFSAVGNTALVVDDPSDGAPSLTGAKKSITGDLLAGDVDVDGPGPLVIGAGTFTTNDGGSVVLESDGDFTYTPAAATSCTDTSDFFDYTVSDQATPTAGTDIGRVTITLADCVWYVNNNAAGNAGTSTAPFDTLAQAQTASAAGHTIFVFDGDNTTTGYNAGFAFKSNQRLLGEVTTLQVGGDVLYTGVPANRPTLTNTGADVVVLALNSGLSGLTLDPAGAGGGISGGAGTGGPAASGVIISDVQVTDTGTLGTQPGIELDTTTGTNTLRDIAVSTGGSATAIGVKLNSAGTVLFDAAGTNTITTAGAKALDAASTSLGTSRINDITVTGSGTGAVRLASTTGTPSLGDGNGTDLSLQTTSGSTAALDISASNGVTVDAGGTDLVSATGGPAIDIRDSNSSTYTFDSVSSTNSANDGINLDTNLTTSFSAPAGAISGAAGIAVDVNGGAGTVTYAGAINDGAGRSAEVTGRTGGSVTLSGDIADGTDAGGGISVSGNSGGSTTFSGASKVLNTGASDAVIFNANGGSLALTGGGLDVDATSGDGIDASSNTGTIEVTGTGNSIQTTTGRALTVANTPISANELTFQSISANGAPNGIALNTTGSAGGLEVTGNGGACATTGDACTGGVIQNTTGDGILLNSTQKSTLVRVKIVNNLGNGVRGSGVTDFALRTSVIDNNGDDPASDEAGLHFTDLAGTAAFTNLLVANSPEDNARIVNSTGTLSQLDVTDSTFRDTDTVSPGNNGLLIQADGGSITADVLGNQFLRNRANGLQVITNGSGSMNVEVDDSVATQSSFDDNNIGVNIAHNSSGTFRYDVRDLVIDGTAASPININRGGSATSDMVGTVTGNTVTNGNSPTGPGLRVTSNGAGPTGMTMLVQNNQISQIANRGIEMIARDGGSRINATIAGNTISLTDTLSADAIHIASGATAADTTTICADITGNTASTAGAGQTGIEVRNRFAGTTFLLEDYAGGATDTGAVQTFLNGLNTFTPGAAANHAAGNSGFTTIADCPVP